MALCGFVRAKNFLQDSCILLGGLAVLRHIVHDGQVDRFIFSLLPAPDLFQHPGGRLRDRHLTILERCRKQADLVHLLRFILQHLYVTGTVPVSAPNC